MTGRQIERQERSLMHDRAFLLVLCGFGSFGMLFGIWQVALADLQQALGLSDGALGAGITAGFVASFPVMLLGGRLADRVGAGGLLASMAVAIAAGFLGLTFVNSYPVLIGLLVLFFGAAGAFDVSINAAGMGVEQRSARRVIPYLHGAFSGSAAAGAILTGVLLYAGVPFRAMYTLVAIMMCALALAAWRGDSSHREAVDAEREGGPGEIEVPSARLYRSPAILLLGGITLLAFLCEGTLETWSAIYLRSSLGVAALVGAAGPATFHGAMLVGRLLSGRVAERLGRRTLLLSAGPSAALGMLVALATNSPPLVLVGLLLAGLALAGVAPVAFSLAGDLAPGRTGEASSVITTVGYGGFLLGPGLIGGLAELAGLRTALSTVVIAGVLIGLLSVRLAAAEHRKV